MLYSALLCIYFKVFGVVIRYGWNGLVGSPFPPLLLSETTGAGSVGATSPPVLAMCCSFGTLSLTACGAAAGSESEGDYAG